MRFEKLSFIDKVDKKPDVWWRYMYIDNVFVIWTHGEECFIEFVNRISNMHSKIQFTAEWSTKSVVFLDVQVIMNNGHVTTDLFTKSTDTH